MGNNNGIVELANPGVNVNPSEIIPSKNKIGMKIFFSALSLFIVGTLLFGTYFYFTFSDENIETGTNIKSAIISEDGQNILIKLTVGTDGKDIIHLKFILENSKGDKYTYETTEGVGDFGMRRGRSFFDWLLGKETDLVEEYDYMISSKEIGLEDLYDIVEVKVGIGYAPDRTKKVNEELDIKENQDVDGNSGDGSGGGGSDDGSDSDGVEKDSEDDRVDEIPGDDETDDGVKTCIRVWLDTNEYECGMNRIRSVKQLSSCDSLERWVDDSCGGGFVCYDGENAKDTDYCVDELQSCVDLDGVDYYNSSKVDRAGVMHEDSCDLIDVGNVIEYYCSYNNQNDETEVKSESYGCVNGCGDGKCLGSPPECELTTAIWDPATAIKGDNVKLQISGTNCKDKIIDYTIYENIPFWFDKKITTNSNVGSTTWIAGQGDNGFNDGDDYYFIASEEDNEDNEVDSKDYGDNLVVSKAVVARTCEDNLKNQDESDTDCGGSICGKCNNELSCLGNIDCVSGYCNAVGVCEVLIVGTCDDFKKNRDESDVDCGGNICDKCNNELSCLGNIDCVSGYCNADGVCKVFLPGNCNDFEKNQDESDWDCGGSICPKCEAGRWCFSANDCDTGYCNPFGGCAEFVIPTCDDWTKNQDETDVNCGGDTCDKCDDRLDCLDDDDCVSGDCRDNVCLGEQSYLCDWNGPVQLNQSGHGGFATLYYSPDGDLSAFYNIENDETGDRELVTRILPAGETDITKFSNEIVIKSHPTSEARLAYAIYSGEDEIVVSAESERVGLFYSFDNGLTWKDGQTYSASSVGAQNNYWTAITKDDDDRLHLFYTYLIPGGKFGAHQTYMATITEDGETQTNEKISDSVFKCMFEKGNDILLASKGALISNDNGQSFTMTMDGDKVFDNLNAGDCYQDSSGTIFVFGKYSYGPIGNDRCLKIRTTDDLGKTWNEIYAQCSGNRMIDPQIAVDGETIMIAWGGGNDGIGNPLDIRGMISFDNGITWRDQGKIVIPQKIIRGSGQKDGFELIANDGVFTISYSIGKHPEVREGVYVMSCDVK